MTFRDMHVPGQPLVVPNPWDVGSARMFEAQGAKALASTSAGAAYALGVTDGDLNLSQMLDAACAIDGAAGVPVSADLENGGGDTADAAADAIRLAVARGLAGASIEDLGTADGDPIYPFAHAVERIEAAAEVARDTGLVLTARSEGLLTGTLTLDAVCARINAFAKAGADVVFAPGLRTIAAVEAVIKAAGDTPVSVLVGGNMAELTLARLSACGVARVSFGSGPARAAYGVAMDAVQQFEQGAPLRYPAQTLSFDKLDRILGR